MLLQCTHQGSPWSPLRVEACTRIYTPGFLHKGPNRLTGFFASSYVPQCPRPFANRLAIGTIGARAANDDSKRVCVPVEWEIGKFERLSQKFLRFSPHFEMFGNSEHGFQISVDGIACPAGLEYVPRTTNPLKPSHEPHFGVLLLAWRRGRRSALGLPTKDAALIGVAKPRIERVICGQTASGSSTRDE